MTGQFQDRVALVTGASRGLGHAVGHALGAAGAHVIALARTVGGLEELDDAIKGAGGTATLVPVDVTDGPALERLGAAVFERWGRLDLWVHCAVHAPALSPTNHIDAKDFDRALAVNVGATRGLIRVLDPLLRQSASGRAVFLADRTGEGERFHAAYQATKQAQIALASAWAREVDATPSFRVIVAAPPPMPTAVRARFYPGEDRSTLTHPTEVARRLVEGLAAGAERVELGGAG